jgi:hypothetical protein
MVGRRGRDYQDASGNIGRRWDVHCLGSGEGLIGIYIKTLETVHLKHVQISLNKAIKIKQVCAEKET